MQPSASTEGQTVESPGKASLAVEFSAGGPEVPYAVLRAQKRGAWPSSAGRGSRFPPACPPSPTSSSGCTKRWSPTGRALSNRSRIEATTIESSDR